MQQLVVPASGIFGATIFRNHQLYGGGYVWTAQLGLSSFSLSIGAENLGLQNLQRPTAVNVSMQVTAMYNINDTDGTETPWARNVEVSWNPEQGDEGFISQNDYNELYVVLKPNQNHYKLPAISFIGRNSFVIIKVSDIKFDIPEYSAVSRGESPTINTFTLNGVADAREPVIIGPVAEQDARNVLHGYTTDGAAVLNGTIYPRSRDYYAYLQTGKTFGTPL